MHATADVDLSPLSALVASVARGAPFETEPMPGGASTRRYFRVCLDDGRSMVGMFVPDATKPDEIDKSGARARWPFLEVRELLAGRGIDVPKLLAEDCDRGWVLLEDLGDDTLANYLLRAPGDRLALYQRAVRDLAAAQAALADLPADSVISARTFDYDLLKWEIDHFREWALEARGHRLSDEDRALFDGIAHRLATRIAGWPRTFVHRDYQSRNLMVRDGKTLVWIDFQDALLGPRVYDLVALLNDSYQKFDRPFVEARLDEFAAAAGLDDASRAHLGLEFDWVTVQRKLKDAGRFVFIDRVKKNASFLQYVTATVQKAHSGLVRLAPIDPDMASLASLLERILPAELRGSEH